MDELIEALLKQTAAITALIESNSRLMMILTETLEDDTTPPQRYMDGTLCR